MKGKKKVAFFQGFVHWFTCDHKSSMANSYYFRSTISSFMFFFSGTAQLDYTSLALSDGGPYLGCCSSLPDHSITVW